MSDGTINLPKRATDPSAPTVDRVKLWVSSVDGKPRITDEAGNTIAFESFFGTDAQDAVNNNPDTNNTTSPQTHVNLPYTISDNTSASRYRIFATMRWGYSTGTRDFRGDLQLNGTTIGDEYRLEPKDTGADQRGSSIYGPVYLNGDEIGSLTGNLNLRFYAQENGDVARVYYGMIEIWRVR